MTRAIGLAALLFAFWLLLSGFFTAFLVAAGAGCAVAVTLLSRRMDLVDHEGQPLHLSLRAALYWPWLLKEIVKSGWDVTRLILHPRMPISPTLVRVTPSQRTDLGLAIHANSITLTPGTLSVEVSRDAILVHALTREGAAGTVSGDMDARVSRFEGRA